MSYPLIKRLQATSILKQPEGVTGYAARDAARELINGWVDALDQGKPMAHIIQSDIASVVQTLQAFGAQALRLAEGSELNHDGMTRSDIARESGIAQMRTLGYSVTEELGHILIAYADVRLRLAQSPAERSIYQPREVLMLVAARDAGLLEGGRLDGDTSCIAHYGQIRCTKENIGILKDLGVELGDPIGGSDHRHFVRVPDPQIERLRAFAADFPATLWPRHDTEDHLALSGDVSRDDDFVMLRADREYVRFLVHSGRNDGRLTVDGSPALEGWIQAGEKMDAMIAWHALNPDYAEHGELTATQYEISIWQERRTPEQSEAGESGEMNCLSDHEEYDGDELIKIARDRGISAANVRHLPLLDTSGIWFLSTSPDEDRDYFEDGIEKGYTLHIHAIDGRTPNADDIKHVAALIGVSLIDPREAPVATPG